MKKSFIASAFLMAVNFCSFDGYAQCSDAGICQLGGYLTEGVKKEMFNFSALYKYGYSGKDDDVLFHSFMLDGSYNFLDNSSVQVLIPYNIQSGPDGNVKGIGDLILSWNQRLFSDEYSSFNASLGIKLATGKDNKDNLPQVYQSGLGTNDVLIGINYQYDKINVGAGYQLSGGRNNNLYKLQKGDDLLLRASYEFELLPDLISITPQFLFIQPMARSSILALSSTGKEIFPEVDKSDKPQLNLLTELEYKIDNNLSLAGNFAIPFFKREVNVDGLTRAFSASFGLMYSFD
jgi:hypothetical protein